jgi:formamidopyrimidine-DNA glycosylase
MPELPDLEVFKENVYKKLTSKKLVSVDVYNQQKVTTPKSLLAEELQGRELTAINRFGKELLFDFAEGRIIAVHLMLNGKISIVDDASAIEKIKFKIFSLNFEKESIVFSDMGGLCTIKYQPISDGVPDALGADFTLEYFLAIAHKKANTNIKAFLIDQKVVKGIGNAYADEILWRARISPHSKVGKIPENVKIELYIAIGSVLKEAVAYIKAIAPEIISGEERSFLEVHNKSKKQTATGFTIIVEKVASKTTYFTEEQIFYQ